MSDPRDRHGHAGPAHPAEARSRPTVKDPVCDMDVTPGHAAGGSAEHAGTDVLVLQPLVPGQVCGQPVEVRPAPASQAAGTGG